MVIINIIQITVLFAIAVWLVPGLLGGVVTTLALRREKIPLDVQDIISIGGQWMLACFLGGLVTFGLLILLSMLLPEEPSAISLSFINHLSFGAGAAVIGVRGARIILNVLAYS